MRHGSVAKILAIQAWGPEFCTQHPHKKPAMEEFSCNPGDGKVETEKSLELSGQLSLGQATLASDSKVRWVGGREGCHDN